MKKTAATAVAAALSLWMASAPSAAESGRAAAPSSRSAARDADDTGRNVRDRDGASVTPMDQSNAAPDVAVTQSIRKAIVADESLSTNAKNVKIVTADGKVTLRGPVKNERERAKIVASAKRAAKAQRLEVDDQLEIERQP